MRVGPSPAASARLPSRALLDRDAELAPLVTVEHWLSSRNADNFPRTAEVGGGGSQNSIVSGNTSVATELLDALAAVRAALPGGSRLGGERAADSTEVFSTPLLDRRDGRYANPTSFCMLYADFTAFLPPHPVSHFFQVTPEKHKLSERGMLMRITQKGQRIVTRII